MKRSGMRAETASHARYIEPRLCPRSVKRGHAESSTQRRFRRKMKWSEVGDRTMSKRA